MLEYRRILNGGIQKKRILDGRGDLIWKVFAVNVKLNLKMRIK